MKYVLTNNLVIYDIKFICFIFAVLDALRKNYIRKIIGKHWIYTFLVNGYATFDVKKKI